MAVRKRESIACSARHSQDAWKVHHMARRKSLPRTKAKAEAKTSKPALPSEATSASPYGQLRLLMGLPATIKDESIDLARNKIQIYASILTHANEWWSIEQLALLMSNNHWDYRRSIIEEDQRGAEDKETLFDTNILSWHPPDHQIMRIRNAIRRKEIVCEEGLLEPIAALAWAARKNSGIREAIRDGVCKVSDGQYLLAELLSHTDSVANQLREVARERNMPNLNEKSLREQVIERLAKPKKPAMAENIQWVSAGESLEMCRASFGGTLPVPEKTLLTYISRACKEESIVSEGRTERTKGRHKGERLRMDKGSFLIWWTDFSAKYKRREPNTDRNEPISDLNRNRQIIPKQPPLTPLDRDEPKPIRRANTLLETQAPPATKRN